MAKIILVSGGARSGKSEFAEQLSEHQGKRVAYVATARPFGREMVARIERHRARRSSDWMTLEAPFDLTLPTDVLTSCKVILIECLYTWTVNRLLQLGDPKSEGWWGSVNTLEAALLEEVSRLVAQVRPTQCCLVLVTSETGLGHLPESPRARAFRDLLGRVNQTAAREASEFYMVFAGVPVELKAIAVQLGTTPASP
jgi:adenosylcobinamide kinase / adenosylcobinamide-phosphate guanylyltransferase